MKDTEIQFPKPAELVTLPSYMNHHDHSYSQIVIGLSGKSEFDVNGSGNYIGPGQGCIVTAGADHAFGGVIGRSDILVLNLPSLTDTNTRLSARISDLVRSDVYFQLDSQIRQLIQMLVQEMQTSPEDEILSRACNDTVMALLSRHISAFKPSAKSVRLDMDQLDRYIESHLSRKITIAQLAGSVFLGESQFHLLFKEQSGITPHQYVLNKRIDFAKSLIEQGGGSLTHVSRLCGFASLSTFTHAFSRLTGFSPTQYKKQFS
ncbi:AraC family transcriptional regulator [Vibrio sp. JC009]|uniref:AraC family transcriptional regulator n=1 Tax=Vibrio sp. JC009 TaxID=2912314 RepID=UPI0023AF241A|nr:AraC family transcriptional regulator [Vibrio sp. JC009]WED23548.1 AraC family transcriptional regulator [Vibrio sp. JC009]